MTTALCFLCCFLDGAAIHRPVALVNEVTGSARLERPDGQTGKRTATPLQQQALVYLETGDIVTVEPKGAVTVVFFNDDHGEQLAPGAYTVKPEGSSSNSGAAAKKQAPPSFLEGSALARNGWNALKGSATGTSAGVTLRSLTEDSPRVVPIKDEIVASDRPHFQWPEAGQAIGYIITVRNARTERLLWKANSKGPSIDYPSQNVALRRNRKYNWQVIVRHKDGTETSHVESAFSVDQERDAREWERIRQLAESRRPVEVAIAMATYDTFDMLSPALAACEHLVQLTPQDPNAWETLAKYDALAGRTGDGHRALALAQKLRKQSIQAPASQAATKPPTAR